MDRNISGKAKGGYARAEKLSAERKKQISHLANQAKAEKKQLRQITHTGTLKIGDVQIPCYVMEDGIRVLSGRGLQDALRLVDEDMTLKPGNRVDRLLGNKTLKSLLFNDKTPDHFLPIKGVFGNQVINGYRGEILADICEGMLEARKRGMLKTERQKTVADQCEILLRGFARVGIIALIDAATGYEKTRSKDALAKILEAFIAKELKPWVKTFPDEFYEELFRLRGLSYSPDSVKRPQYFGIITNDIVYYRIAPIVLDELKKVAEKNTKGERKHKLFQRLTDNVGHPKLQQHLASVITIMKLSDSYGDFLNKLDRIHRRFGQEVLPLEFKDAQDDGKGI